MTKFLEGQAQTAERGAPPREYLSSSRHITSAQLLALIASAPKIELIPSPGPRKVIVPHMILIETEGGTPYTNPANNFIDFDADEATGLFNALGSALESADPKVLYGTLADGATLYPDAAIVMGHSFDPSVDGDFGITVRIEYEIIEL